MAQKTKKGVLTMRKSVTHHMLFKEHCFGKIKKLFETLWSIINNYELNFFIVSHAKEGCCKRSENTNQHMEWSWILQINARISN